MVNCQTVRLKPQTSVSKSSLLRHSIGAEDNLHLDLERLEFDVHSVKRSCRDSLKTSVTEVHFND